MNKGETSNTPAWESALRRVGEGGSPDERGPLVFLEQRQDVLVSLDDQSGSPSVDSTRIEGLAVRGSGEAGPSVCLASPQPDDVAPLVDFAMGRTRSVPRRDAGRPGPEHERPAAWLQVEKAVQLLTRAMNTTVKLQPGAAVRARYVGFEQRVRVARPGRPVVLDVRRGNRIRLEATVEGGGQDATVAADLVLPPDVGSGEPVQGLAERVCMRLQARHRAMKLASGLRTVAFGPGVGGVLVHETVGHALEADAALGGTSWLVRRAGENFAGSSELRVVDDPRRGRAAWRIDDEGEPVRPTFLIRDGKVESWIHDLGTARRSRQSPTGHGRRSSFREPVRPRMGCTFVAPGRHAPEEVLDGMNDGVYVRRMEAATTDTRTGRAVFRVTDADLVRDGRLGAPLKPHLIDVDAAEALASVERVAYDLAFDSCVGSCLRDGQPLSSSVGAPTFRIGPTRVIF